MELFYAGDDLSCSSVECNFRQPVSVYDAAGIQKGWRTKEPGDTPYYLNENIFQGAIDVLFEAGYLTPTTLLRLFKKYGITLYASDIEELLHLREDTLKEESEAPRIIELKQPMTEVDDAEGKRQE